MHKIRRRTTKRAEDVVEKTRNTSIRAKITAEKRAKAEINTQRKTKELGSKKSKHI